MIMIMHSGYFVMVAKGFVSWKSVKKTLTTSSTMEAKYVACFMRLLVMQYGCGTSFHL